MVDNSCTVLLDSISPGRTCHAASMQNGLPSSCVILRGLVLVDTGPLESSRTCGIGTGFLNKQLPESHYVCICCRDATLLPPSLIPCLPVLMMSSTGCHLHSHAGFWPLRSPRADSVCLLRHCRLAVVEGLHIQMQPFVLYR